MDHLVRVGACASAVAAVLAAAGCQVQSDVQGVYDVPRLTSITIDGRTDDWSDGGLRIEAVPHDRIPPPASDFEPRLRFAWSDRGLLLLVEANDDTLDESSGDLWRCDGVEVFLGLGSEADTVLKLMCSPGLAAGGRPRKQVYHYVDAADRDAAVATAARRTDSGYAMELLIPWEACALRARRGAEVAVQVRLNDADGEGSWRQVRFSGPVGGKQPLRLAESASPPVRLVASGVYEPTHVRITVHGAASLIGRTVRLLRDGAEVARAKLEDAGGRARAQVRLALPPPGEGMGRLVAAAEGAAPAAVNLPDIEGRRKRAVERAEIVFDAYVFSGTSLPTCRLKHPAWFEALLGSCELDVTYHNADYEQVTEAAKAGRYGAVVTLTAGGRTARRFQTLYRSPGRVGWRQWRDVNLSVTPSLPSPLGVKDDVARKQAETIAEYLKWRLADGLREDGGAAVLLAGLAETPAAEPPAVDRTNVWSRDARWWFDLRRKLGLFRPRYLVFLPDGYEQSGSKCWPLMLFLHGAGERGDDLSKVKVHGPPKMVSQGRSFPFILVAPQCDADRWWVPIELGALLDEVEARYRVDRDRVYVTGMSMGGFGTWAVALEYPDRFAAIAPICGGGDPRDAARIRHVPAWVFHGARDGAVPIEGSRKMVEALKAAGGHVQFTVYPDAGHDSWSATYANPDLYDWLLANRRGKSAAAPKSTDPPGKD
jgi:pimeloyl-ACP methyl ester carboxylesterase